MTNEEKVQYWVNLSNEDMEVAGIMLREKKSLYLAFMCHQSIEKIFKGYFCKLKEETPPFTHDLVVIAKQGGFWDKFSEDQQNFTRQLGPLNIRTRYPDYRSDLTRNLTIPRCEYIFEQTNLLQQWIKEKI